MSREDAQMKVRLPAAVKVSLEEAATKSGRSLNAEVVARLEATFEGAMAADVAFLLAKKDHEATTAELKYETAVNRAREFGATAHQTLEQAYDRLEELVGDQPSDSDRYLLSELDDVVREAEQLSRLDLREAKRRLAEVTGAAEESGRRLEEALSKALAKKPSP